jgi:hypothetical protein
MILLICKNHCDSTIYKSPIFQSNDSKKVVTWQVRKRLATMLIVANIKIFLGWVVAIIGEIIM